MMLFIENIRLALSSLLANKARAFLTMLGIIIGIASVIAIMTVGNSLTVSVSSSMQSMGANNVNVSVQPRSSETDESKNGIVFGTVDKTRSVTEDDYFTDDMIYSLLNDFQDSIDAVSVNESVGSATITNHRDEADINVTGVSLGFFQANNLTMEAGNIIQSNELTKAKNVAVVSDRFVEDLWGISNNEAIGREFTAKLKGQEVAYTIIGVYKYEESAMMGRTSDSTVTTAVYIPITTAQQFNHTKNYSSMSIVTRTGTDPDDLATKIENYLKGNYRSNKYYTVSAYSMSSLVSTMSDMMSTITLAISVIAGIALLVGGIGVMNIMLVSITERTKEIGTRKALGAENSSIRMQFIVEAMIICLIGGVIGVLLGIGLGMFAANLLGYPASPSVSSILISLLFSLAIGVFFGYYPANKAAKMNPIDALRYE